jgi:hypothetical protein
LAEHLGFQINFQQGKLQITPQKVKGLKKELGKFVKKAIMSKKQVAAILGHVKSNLVAMPFLRAITGLLVKILAEKASLPWDSKHPIPTPIKDQLKEIKFLLENWSGRNFPQSPNRFLHSDSVGGLGNKKWKFCSRILEGHGGPPLHINKKELIAATNTIKSLSKGGKKYPCQ